MSLLPSMMAPRTARHARLLRLANKLSATGTPGAPKSEAEKIVWVNSHTRRLDDVALSAEEERLRERKLPWTADRNAPVVPGQNPNAVSQNLFIYRDHPMFPGEYIPPQHNALASLRDELKCDLTAQSVKQAWARVSSGRFFDSAEAFYRNVDGLDEGQLAEIVSAMFPDMGRHESAAMVRRVLEAISKPDSSPVRRLASTVTAESLGLDKSPGHYANFLEWMSRMMETKAFATEHCIYQFCRRRFNRNDLRIMYNNYLLLSNEAMTADASDGYSHFHSILKDYAVKVAGADTRHQIGVRIDPQESDERLGGMTYGYAFHRKRQYVCMLRENRSGQGRVMVNGKPLAEAFQDRAWHMEKVFAPFTEAGLNIKDFDVFFRPTAECERYPELSMDDARAMRVAVAQCVSKLLPIKRIPLKKSGMLSIDRYQEPGVHPRFYYRSHIRPFFKRA